MKKIFTLVVAMIGLQTLLYAQCELYVSEGQQIHVHDTTFLELMVDTSAVGPGYSCAWTMPDGSTRTGFRVYYPFTETGGYVEIPYTITGPGCSYNNVYPSMGVNFVFNCSALPQYHLPGFFSEVQQTGPNANDVKILLDNFYAWDTALKTNMYFDWGNGHTTFKRDATDNFLSIGGIDDPGHTSQYRYAGTYAVTLRYNYSYDTMTCPVVYADTAMIRAGGMPAVPLITGATSYCAGDTLHLEAVDTTAQFGNLYHLLQHDYPLIYNYYEAYWYDPQRTGSGLIYEWFNYDYTPLPNWDTSLTLANLSTADTGVYRLHVFDVLTFRDTEALVHINVTGTLLSVDSAVKPSCIASGNIYLDLHRANDSVSIAYKLDGVPQTFNGRANTAGKLTLPAVTSGVYTDIQARFVGDACPSNICTGPYRLPTRMAPVVSPNQYFPCAGSSVTLSASGALPGEGYLWAGPGGFSSTLQSPVITAAATVTTDVYTVYITAPGCGLSQPSQVYVYTSATAPPSVSGRHFLPACQGQPIYVSGNYTNVTVTSSDTTIVNHSLAVAPGTVTLTWINYNNCGADTLTDTMTVLPAPVLPAITGPDAICGSDTVTYTIAATGGTWSTSFIDGSIISNSSAAGTSTANVRPATGSGGLILTYSKSIGTCTTRASKSILHGRPYTAPAFAGNSKGLYPGESVTITLSPSTYFYTAPISFFALNTDTVLTQPAPMLIAAGSRNGSALLSHYTGNSCGTDTASTEVFVNDWINTTIAGRGTIDVPTASPVAGTGVRLYNLSRIARDTTGNLYIFDEAFIHKQTADGRLTTIAGVMPAENDWYWYSATGDNGPASLAKITSATDIASDAQGNLYLNCPYNNVIRKISPDGIIKHFAGVKGTVYRYYAEVGPTPAYYDHSGYTGDGGPATAAKINATLLAADDAGNVYFTDKEHNRVRKIDATGIITTIGGNGVNGYTGDGGPATAAAIGAPTGIAVDKNGNVIISSKGSLRKIAPSGIITTIAGVTGGASTAGTTAMNTAPLFDGEVKTDRLGNIFVSGSHNVKKIDTAGVVSTITNTAGFYTTIDSFSAHAAVAQSIQPDDSGLLYAITGGNTVVKMGKPLAEVSPSIDSQCVASAPVTFTAMAHNSGDHTSFQWKKNGVNVGTDSRMYYDPAIVSGDTVSVKVYLSAGGLMIAEAGRKMSIDSATPAPTVTIAGGSTLCVGATTSITSTTTGGTWGVSSSAAMITGNIVTGLSAGSALISYTVSNVCGTSTDTMQLTVNANPIAGSITGDSTLCASGSTTLASTATGGIWATTNGTVTVSASGAITASTAGTDTILYIVTNTCGADTARQTITVTEAPAAGTITGLDSICQGSGLFLVTSATGGVWSSSDTNIISVTAAGMVTASTPGTATLSYAITNSCGTATATHTIHVIPVEDCNPSAVGTATAPSVAIYPNPTTGSFTVVLARPDADAVITVSDLSGRVVKEVSPAGNATQIPVSISNLASGTYLVKITTGGVVYNQKIVLW